MADVKFIKGLPESGRYKYDWDDITTKLRARPGTWAMVEGKGTKGTPGSAQAAARAIRKGEIKGTKAGEFEATTRETTVYARYVGTDES